MYAMSLIEPWLQLILNGKKTVEFRTWARPWIMWKDLLLCSSKKVDKVSVLEGLNLGWITQAEVREFMSCLGHARCLVMVKDMVGAKEDVHGDQPGFSHHANGKPIYAWELENVRPIRPFPVKGRLGIFHVENSLIQPLEL